MPILTTPATAKPNLLQESLAITNERKPATTINLDAVNRGIGNRHVLKDKDRNLDDSNFRDKMDCSIFRLRLIQRMKNLGIKIVTLKNSNHIYQ